MLSSENLPVLETCATASGKRSTGKQSTAAARRSAAIAAAAAAAVDGTTKSATGSTTQSSNQSSSSPSVPAISTASTSAAKYGMTVNAPPFYLPLTEADRQELNANLATPRRHIGERLLPRVQALEPVCIDVMLMQAILKKIEFFCLPFGLENGKCLQLL